MSRRGKEDPAAKAAALRLIRKIEDYWLKRGYSELYCWLDEDSAEGKDNGYRFKQYPIRSNLNQYGFPPK